ncbi:hypothetical protein NIES2111_42460 [Nostoc sp. NIES-2111]|nr:hypothetical protein NIES2111_42460 [Nostoc sp. NIES-2111]
MAMAQAPTVGDRMIRKCDERLHICFLCLRISVDPQYGHCTVDDLNHLSTMQRLHYLYCRTLVSVREVIDSQFK